MDIDTLAKCTGAHEDSAARFADVIDAAMAEFEINTPTRQAMFLANVGEESGGLHYLHEIWGPTDAQSGYEGREDLGNTEPGDGFKFRGRGLIETTGRTNYARVGDALGLDLINSPELLEEPVNAARSAGWFWKEHDLNELADTGDFIRIVKRINGGIDGLPARQALLAAAKDALGITDAS